MKITKFAAWGALILVAAAASAQVTKQGNGYVFRYKWTPGAKSNYTMNANGGSQGQTFTMTSPIAQRVKSVAGGIATVDFTVGPMKMMMNGKPMNMGDAKPTSQTVKIDSRGKVSGAATNVSGSIALPAGPIPVGGSWSDTTTTSAGMAGNMKVAATYKFIGLQNVGGRQVARINVTMKGTGQANVTGSGVIYLSVADGSLVRNENTMNITMPQMPQPMKMTMSIVRK